MEALTLPALYDSVAARFERDGVRVPNFFGWRERERKEETGDRIVWVPGDPNGSLGTLSNVLTSKLSEPATRVLATLGELFTVYLFASDPTDPENQKKQYAAARALFNTWWAAAWNSANATLKPVSLNWYLEGTAARRYGAAIRGVFSIVAPIPDQTLEAVSAATAHAAVTVDLLDRSETFTAPPED